MKKVGLGRLFKMCLVATMLSKKFVSLKEKYKHEEEVSK